MLETQRERVKLLKAGISGKTIEQLYLTYNNFKVIRTSTHFELVEIDDSGNHNPALSRESAPRYVII